MEHGNLALTLAETPDFTKHAPEGLLPLVWVGLMVVMAAVCVWFQELTEGPGNSLIFGLSLLSAGILGRVKLVSRNVLVQRN